MSTDPTARGAEQDAEAGPGTGAPVPGPDRPPAGARSPELARLAQAVRAIESGDRPAAPAPPPTAPAPAPVAPSAAPATTPLPAEPVAAARQVLGAGGAPAALAGPAMAVLGERAGELLREDPWRVLSLPGVRLDQADGFARTLLGPACGPGDERRGRAVLGRLLEQAAEAGHTALEWPVLADALAKQSVPDAETVIRRAVEEGQVMVFHEERPTPGAAPDDETPVTVLLALDRYALAEESLADALVRLANSVPSEGAPGSVGAEDDADDERRAGDAESADEPAVAEDADAAGGSGNVDAAGPGEDGPVPGSVADAETAGQRGSDDAARPTGNGQGADGAGQVTDGQGAGQTRGVNGTDGAEEAGPGGDHHARSAVDWEAAAGAAPTPSAAELIRAVAGHGLVAHTGGEAARAEPAALVAAARAAGLRAYAAAFTPDGRRRLAESIGPGGDEAAVTVDGLLSGAEGPGRDAEGAFALDLLAVVDAPRLDVELAATLVESVPDGARLVLSGDPAVLWSAGPGRVFADLLAARVCPQVVSRTPDPGPVGELVSGIGVGELTPVDAPGREVVIVPVRDPGEAVHRTVQLVADSIPRAIGVPAPRTQVVTVGHGGPVGTRALNAALKERLNPGPGRFGGFDPGDRVVYVPAPGRALPATVTSGDAAGLHLECEGAAVVVPPDQVAAAVRHGWALTAHQAAGSRWPAVVAVVPGDAGQALTRQWVYTAFGRAETHLSVVQGADLQQTVVERPAKERTTRLRAVLGEHGAGLADA